MLGSIVRRMARRVRANGGSGRKTERPLTRTEQHLAFIAGGRFDN